MYPKLMSRYKTLVDRLEKIELWLGTFLLTFLTLIVLLEVVSRYLFNRPYPWVLELTILLMTYMVFVAVPALYKGRSLVIIEFFFRKLPASLRKFILFFWEILIGFFSVVLTISTYQFMLVQMRYKSPTLDIPVAYFTFPLLLCAISMLIFNIYFILGHLETFLKGKKG